MVLKRCDNAMSGMAQSAVGGDGEVMMSDEATLGCIKYGRGAASARDGAQSSPGICDTT